MVPPRVPQFNWIDLGLPSGTLWLDRLVGAPSPLFTGLYYQWGAVKGHTGTDGYVFTTVAYSAQGLDLISTNLSEEQDAARAFYGPNAKMPSVEQLNELVQNTSMQTIRSGLFKLTSLINGNSILLKAGGIRRDNTHLVPDALRAWCNGYHTELQAYSLQSMESVMQVSRTNSRTDGLSVLAVHS